MFRLVEQHVRAHNGAGIAQSREAETVEGQMAGKRVLVVALDPTMLLFSSERGLDAESVLTAVSDMSPR
jgi:hypothetical protein